MDASNNTHHIYNLHDGLMFGFCESPDELVVKYGFRCNKSSDSAYVYTTADGILFGGERYVGMFRYENDDFKSLELRPITGIGDGWQSERKLTAEAHICEKAVSIMGKRAGQFQIRVVKRIFRDASSLAEYYAIVITKHPFFTELCELLEDSSMTDEEVVNNITQIEVLVDKYKDAL